MRSPRARPEHPVRRVVHPTSHGLGIPLSKVGFPIRKSTDQSFFAAPRGLSQRSTSFIASQRQGIHQTPLFHLIALIINAHPLGVGSLRIWSLHSKRVLNGTLIQKDQLASRSRQRCLRSGSHRHCCVSACDSSRAKTWSRSPLHDVRQHARLVERRSVRICFLTDEPEPAAPSRNGGARRDRTDDLLLAKQALSQLSYGPGPWR
jgi:hypothetical protein